MTPPLSETDLNNPRILEDLYRGINHALGMLGATILQSTLLCQGRDDIKNLYGELLTNELTGWGSDMSINRHKFTHWKLGIIIIGFACGMPNHVAADAVLEWNELLLQAARSQAMPPTTASRAMAMVHLSIYDAVNSIDRTHAPYSGMIDQAQSGSRQAAVTVAAHDALDSLFPSQRSTFDRAQMASLASIPDGPEKSAGIAVGQSSARHILDLRRFDHSAVATVYTPGTNAGDWRPTPPGFAPAVTPNWGQVTPFALMSGSQFRPPPPPSLTSAEYVSAFNEVKDLGHIASSGRTPAQTETGIFWAYDRPGVGPPPIVYNQIAQSVAESQGNTLGENARLFALLNMALADAAIATWDAKYTYNFWRPITAIRAGDFDGNPSTIGDPHWIPLGAPGGDIVPDFTPAHPAYISGHATFGAAAFGTLAQFYGGDDIGLMIASDQLPGLLRSYNSFSAVAEEIGRSRIYLGIHWDFDDQFGRATGNQIADFVFTTKLQPIVAEPSSFTLLCSGLVGLGLLRKWLVKGGWI